MYSITLIEDSPSDVMLLRMALDKAELAYQLNEISEGQSVLQKFSELAAPPDLIITDFIVPGMDFESFLGMLRSMPHLRNVPVIVMSGMRNANLAQTLQGQVADYLVKPANLDGWREIGERVKNRLDRTSRAESGA